ncbi:hypothetical protein [Metabacillus rhizolycopersici]|jgi:uncharacterized coiled-coil DUF342 family protein|uniref:Aspartyl-phosphate phosphatase Spo0E family protein n=1 Tax=Metabacillus rhizolycopersici TaxID=2875709 RepID=A0ABS7UTQ8_9BACI|nr:hypothetical protein [Metabacillus rhizolycopersici]MBZ5751511.1 hypothetical protein [Metabacillus rhizolycopersici]
MKNIVEKSVIVRELAELEQEIFALEKVLMNKVSTKKIGQKIIEDAARIDEQLTDIISCLDRAKDTHLKNDNDQSHASIFPLIATNV